MHKPTWNPAVGRSGGNGMEGGFAGPKSHHHSVRAIASQTRMKLRAPATAGALEASRVARATELAEREAAHYLAKGDRESADAVRRSAAAMAQGSAPATASAVPAKLATLTDTRGLAASVDQTALQAELTAEEVAMLAELEGADADVEVGVTRATKRPREEQTEGSVAEPADAVAAGATGWSDDDEDDDDDDDSDDEEALLAELAEVRREREAEAAQQRERDEAAAAAEVEAAAATGNPLLRLAGDGGGAIRRRWDEDVVFRNQASGAPAPGRRFINDTLRNDFHLRFMRKYIQ